MGKYEEALERAKQGLPIDEVFPELKESEDERIARIVLDLPFKHEADYNFVRAYLEKQKEQKPNVELIQKSWYLEGYHDGKYNNEPKWLIQTGKGGPMYEENPKYGTQKPAEWSEEDKKLLDIWLDVIDRNDWRMDESFCKASREFINRLKSLRPRPKQDVFPSLREKEIICLKRALDYLRKEHNRYGGEDFTNEIAVLEWLITHPILVSDTHWKPSAEQIDAIHEANFRCRAYQFATHLTEIEIQLEKLMNE